MHVLTHEQTLALLSHDEVAGALDAMLATMHSGQAHAPVRSAVDLGNRNVFLLMPAVDTEHACVKLVTVHAGNPARGLSSIQGEAILLDAATGQRLLMLDGPAVTALRTAALSLLGARKLVGRPRGKLLLVGAGAQARSHARCFANNGDFEAIYISSRQGDSARALAAELVAEGFPAQAVARPEDVIDQVNLIITTTSSTQPVLPDTVAPGTLIVAVGAYRHDMAELSPALVQAAHVYVDTIEGAKEEAGDLLQADIDWSRVTPLDGIKGPAPTDGRPIIYKTVGHALWDLATLKLAHRKLAAR